MQDSPTCMLTKGNVPLFFLWKSLLSEFLKGKPSTNLQRGVRENSQVRFGSSVDWNCPELSPHAQVLANYSHQRHAGYIDEPPGQGGWKMSVIDPAADHMEKVYGDGKVQALLPPADEEPKTKSTCKRVQDECHHRESALHGCKTEEFIAEDLVQ